MQVFVLSRRDGIKMKPNFCVSTAIVITLSPIRASAETAESHPRTFASNHLLGELIALGLQRNERPYMDSSSMQALCLMT